MLLTIVATTAALTIYLEKCTSNLIGSHDNPYLMIRTKTAIVITLIAVVVGALGIGIGTIPTALGQKIGVGACHDAILDSGAALSHHSIVRICAP
jgi:hypothetical protein